VLSLNLFSQKISFNSINLISVVVSYINFAIVLLQVSNVIPVAQDNIREGLNLITDRPTGLLFNAFAMGYASVITFSIAAFFIKERKYVILNLLAATFSIGSIILSVTRTPLILIAISTFLILFQSSTMFRKRWKFITISLPVLLIAFPIISVIVGNLMAELFCGIA
jgi:hypothetical protein